MQGLVAQVPPAIQATEHCTTGNAGGTDPVEISLHRAEALQGWYVMSRAEVVPVTLTLWQEQAHARTGFGLDMFDLQPTEFVTTKTPPEADQQQRRIAPAAKQACQIAGLLSLFGFPTQLLNCLLQVLQLQRRSLLRLRRMQCADAFEHLTHCGCLGRIRKTLGDMPLSQGGQALFERAEAQRVGVFHQVAHDVVAGGGQEAAPRHFEVLDGRLVAAAGVFPRTSL